MKRETPCTMCGKLTMNQEFDAAASAPDLDDEDESLPFLGTYCKMGEGVILC